MSNQENSQARRTQSASPQVLAAFWQRVENAQQKGDEQAARAWLEGIVELDAQNVDAWLALARLTANARERMEYYSNVLQLSPGHQEAKDGLRQARRQL